MNIVNIWSVGFRIITYLHFLILYEVQVQLYRYPYCFTVLYHFAQKYNNIFRCGVFRIHLISEKYFYDFYFNIIFSFTYIYYYYYYYYYYLYKRTWLLSNIGTRTGMFFWRENKITCRNKEPVQGWFKGISYCHTIFYYIKVLLTDKKNYEYSTVLYDKTDKNTKQHVSWWHVHTEAHRSVRRVANRSGWVRMRALGPKASGGTKKRQEKAQMVVQVHDWWPMAGEISPKCGDGGGWYVRDTDGCNWSRMGMWGCKRV